MKQEEKKYAPKWLYHKELGAKLITSEAEEKALEKGWEDTPAKFETKGPAHPKHDTKAQSKEK